MKIRNTKHVRELRPFRAASRHWNVITAGLVIGLTASPVCGQQTLDEKLRRLVLPYVESEEVVGISVGVIRDGDWTTVHLGSVDENGDLPNDDTVYEIGSISKVFTGLLLADAVVRGQAELEQAVQSMLPEGTTMPTFDGKTIQLVELSTHRSGLPRLPANMSLADLRNPYASYESKDAFEFLNSHKLRREPGEKYEYSNFAASLLGNLLCRRAGLDYDELLTERITGPLLMNDTHVALNDSMRERLAGPHLQGGQPATNWDFADMPGAGGIRSTTSDMLKFAKANLDPPDDELGKAIELAYQQHQEADASGPPMGLGWHFAGDGSTRWHNGQTGGYHSMLMLDRTRQLAVVILCNTASGEVDRLANDLMLMLAGANIPPREFAKAIEVPEEVMKRYVGKYQLAPNFVFTVSVDDGKLMVGVTNQPTLQVFAKSDTVWFYKAVPAELTFNMDADGKCESVELFQNGVRQTAKRVE